MKIDINVSDNEYIRTQDLIDYIEKQIDYVQYLNDKMHDLAIEDDHYYDGYGKRGALGDLVDWIRDYREKQ